MPSLDFTGICLILMYLLQDRLRPVWTGFLRFFAVLVHGPWFLKLSGTSPVRDSSTEGPRTGTRPDLEALRTGQISGGWGPIDSYVFILLDLCILLTLSIYIRPMQSHKGQQQRMQAHNGPQKPTHANKSQHRPVMAHNSECRCTKANTGSQKPRPTRGLGSFGMFLFPLFIIFTNHIYSLQGQRRSMKPWKHKYLLISSNIVLVDSIDSIEVQYIYKKPT